MKELGTLGGRGSAGFDINASGQVTGTSEPADGTTRAFLWDPAFGMLDLNDLVPPDLGWDVLEEARAINDAGQITGYGFINGQARAFLLMPSVRTDIPEPGTPAPMMAALLVFWLLGGRCRFRAGWTGPSCCLGSQGMPTVDDGPRHRSDHRDRTGGCR